MRTQAISTKIMSILCASSMLCATFGCQTGDPVLTEEVRITVTAPSGTTHHTVGTVEELVLPIAGVLPEAYKLGSLYTTDPAQWLQGGHAVVPTMGGAIELVAQDGTAIATQGDQLIANLSWSTDLTSLVLDVGGESPYRIDASGIPTEARPAFIGGLALRFLQGNGVQEIAGLDEAQAIIVVILVAVILIEVGVIISQIGNYATISECRAQLPGDCQAQAAQECEGKAWSCSRYACTCGFSCSFGFDQPGASCETACGETEAECLQNLDKVADVQVL